MIARRNHPTPRDTWLAAVDLSFIIINLKSELKKRWIFFMKMNRHVSALLFGTTLHQTKMKRNLLLAIIAKPQSQEDLTSQVNKQLVHCFAI